MEYMLLVTWFLGGNATSSYQVYFATRPACEVALSDLRNDARRLASSRDNVRTIGGGPQTADATPSDSSPTPVLSAICVNQR